MTEISQLTALSPLDGRYASKTAELRGYFSEHALFRFRLQVEIAWLSTLASTAAVSEVPALSAKAKNFLQSLVEHFSESDSARIKAIEAVTNHDVKAMEYFIKEKFSSLPELKKISEFVHFACTSEDINNLAYALMLEQAREKVLVPILDHLVKQLKLLGKKFAKIPMLSRTHGQPASPTTLGKELANFVTRFQSQLAQFKKVKIKGKFNGAVGNFNAHQIAYPEIDWPSVAKKFVQGLGLDYNAHTAQIEPHDFIAEYSDALARINRVLIDLAADCWGYISLGYFRLKTVKNEVGSSTMPHKVNPIDFENAEGNLHLANSLLHHFSVYLPRSRWQRDLRDSTLLRNLGVPLGHALIAYQALLKGLQKLQPDMQRLKSDLDEHSEVLAEAIQTVLRRYGKEQPYEQLKALTRGQSINIKVLHDFIKKLDLPRVAKERLLILTPSTYIGFAKELAENIEK